jgi:hypothetical protein
MEEEEFRAFLKRGGRSKSAIARCIRFVKDFEHYLELNTDYKVLHEADAEALEGFINWIEKDPKASANTHLWALRYYFEFSNNEDLHYRAGIFREERIQRTAFPLRKFRDVNPEDIEKLEAVGIKNIDQMLKKGRTPGNRKELSQKTGVSQEAILELVKLSDLARIPGIKGIRARLYVDAGVDTVEKLAACDPKAFREMIVEFVERTGFDGIPTLAAEARFSVEKAKNLPKIVEYS